MDNIFSSAFNTAFRSVSESVLDYPNGKTLSKDIWELCRGKYTLKRSVSQKVKQIAEYVQRKLKLKDVSVCIVGSICSNSYSEDSDIDVHLEVDEFRGKSDEFMRDMNKKAEDAFTEKFGELKFDGHPVECYIQGNRFQDHASVGCYDVIQDKWLSGPQILDDDFDPYKKYFDSSVRLIEKDNLIEDIRKLIFDAGTVSKAILNASGNSDDKFIKKLEGILDGYISDAKALFKRIRLSRTVASSPKSDEDARRMRTSQDWKTKDASFKFMDKMGFLSVLKEIRSAQEECDGPVEKAEYVINGIKDKLFGEHVRTGSYGR